MDELKTLSFDSRETYLAWRSAWKSAYASNALEVRKHKRLRKASVSGHEMASWHRGAREDKRGVARDLLDLLIQAKTAAAKQWVEQRKLAA